MNYLQKMYLVVHNLTKSFNFQNLTLKTISRARQITSTLVASVDQIDPY